MNFWSKQRQKEILSNLEEGRREFSLTNAQLSVYMEHICSPDIMIHHMFHCVELPADLDVGHLKRIVKKSVACYPFFCVNVVLSNGDVAMCLHPEFLKAEIPEWETESMEEVKREFIRPFALEGEPLYRMALCRYMGRWYFLFDVHRIIFDDGLMKEFLKDILLLYHGTEPR